MSDTLEIQKSIAFDENKQAAFLGWCFRDGPFFAQASRTVKPDWFADAFARKAYKSMLEISEAYHRHPEPTEVPLWRGLNGEDSATRAKIEQIIAKSLELSMGYGLDILRNDIQNWMDASDFVAMVQRAVPLFNNKQVDKAWEVVKKVQLKKDTSSFATGVYQGFTSAADNLLLERLDRMRQARRMLEYGVPFLDDALFGIRPKEFILLAAAAGAGKTQMAQAIALHNAQKGKRVHMFALEADQYEIERRIKYRLISNQYFATTPQPKYIDYGAWVSGELEDVLGPIEDAIGDDCIKAVQGLNLLYRKDGNFDVQAMEQELLALVGKTDLIILDHLHYIDTGNEQENVAYAQVAKSIRDFNERYEIPVIVICHLRKDAIARGKAKLVANLQDIHGTSNIGKIATTAIMLGRAFDQPASRPGYYLQPTYMRICKSRMEGSRTYFIALTEFNSRTNTYEDMYQLGKGEEQDTEWKRLEEILPWQSRLKKILQLT